MKVVTFGCRMNVFESAVISKLGADVDDNVVVVNTCAVTSEAERQCRQTIRKLRRENPKCVLIVTGCAAQLHPELYAKMPEVDRILGNHEKLDKKWLHAKNKGHVGDVEQAFELPIVTDFEGRSRAFLQIQQGCDHACTFCIVRFARGPNRGISPEQVLTQAKAFADAGYQELVLTGADVVSYPYNLWKISRQILEEVPQIKRLRYGSLDPAPLNQTFINLLKKYPQIMPYFHLSIQAGDNLILKRMGRRHTREQVLDLIHKVREVCPQAVFGADFITGFPTETEDQFLQTMDLVKQANITKLHVFPYSEREGTPAAKMPQVPVPIRKERAARLRKLGAELSQNLLQQMVGEKVSVLVEESSRGWTENYLNVILNKEYNSGEIVSLTIKGVKDNALVG